MKRFLPKVPVGPDGFQFCLTGYSFSLTISWFASPQVFYEQDAYKLMADISVPQVYWAIFLLTYSCASLFCLGYGTNQKKIQLAWVGAALWFFLGFMMLGGGYLAGFVTAVGIFHMFLSVFSVVVMDQYHNQEKAGK